MADDDTSFEDRWADVPEEVHPDELSEDEKKKLELLKLVSPPDAPVPGPDKERGATPPLGYEAPARIPEAPLPPPPPVDIMPRGMFSRLLPPPAMLPGAPLAKLPSPPLEAAPPPPQSPVEEAPSIEEVDELQRLLSKDAPVSAELERGEVGPSKDARVRKLASEIPPVGMALLDTIATREAEPAFKDGKRAGWNTMVGGERFDPNTPEHPHKAYPNMRGFVGGAGRSYASGRYQETTQTYYENVARSEKLHPGVNVRGWSEEAQNIRNWDKAQEVYRRATGRDLKADLEANKDNPEAVGRMSRALSAEWTSAPGGREGSKITGGKESYYGTTFLKMLKDATAQPLADAQLAQFMGGQPMAQQKVPLERGTPETSASAEQFAELMRGGTPIEKIQGIAKKMDEAAVRGAVRGKAPMVTRPVRPGVERTMPEGVLPQEGSVTHTRPMPLPMPGMGGPMGDLYGPSFMSTILADQGMRAGNAPPPPVEPPPAPAGPNPLMSMLKSLPAVAPSNMLTNPVQAVKAMVDMFNNAKEIYDATNTESVANVGKGVVSGFAQQPTGAFNTFVGLPAAAIGLLTGLEGPKAFASESLKRGEEWRMDVNKALGLKEGAPGQVAGETLGQNLAVTGSSLLMNLARTGIQTAAQPYVHKFAQAYPLQPIIGSAQAAPVTINTPGGDVRMNDAQLSEFVYGGALMMGIGLTPAALSRGARVAREWSSTIRDRFIDPRSAILSPTGVNVAPGTVKASLPRDLLKATTVDTPQAMIDVLNRHARMEKPTSSFWDIIKGRDHGIDPVAAQEVKEKFHIQTRSGANHLVNQALSNGQLSTRDFQFRVNTPIAKISEFIDRVPQFADYLKLKMIGEQLDYNDVQYQKLSPAARKTSGIARSYQDADGNIWTRTGVPGSHSPKAQASALEAQFPEFAKVYQDVRANIQETQRFITLNPNNVENVQRVIDRSIHQPTMPIFSANTKTDKMMKKILDGENPLRVIEDHMGAALHKQMKSDADLTYLDHLPASALTERTEKWVKTRGAAAVQAGAVLKRKVDGEYKYWTMDPFLVSALNSGDVPAASMGTFMAGTKRVFTSTTTGSFAPWFSFVAGHRAMWQGITTMPRDIKLSNGRTVPAPLYIASGMAALRSALPQYAELYAPSVKWFEDRIAASPLGKMLPQAQHNLFSRTLHKYYNDSFYNQMAMNGGISGGAIIDAIDSHAKITQLRVNHANGPAAPMLQYLQNAAEMAKGFWGGMKFIGKNIEIARTSIADAPQMAYGYRISRPGVTRHGQALHPSEVGSIVRNYTGDPAVRGLPYSRNIEGAAEPFRFNARNVVEEKLYKGAQAAGHTMDFARAITPWAGVLVQSPGRTWQVLKENPIRANTAFALTGALPEAVAYMWNMSMVDPTTGKPTQEYIDYQFNGRSDYNTMNNLYVAVPGKKPWEGIEVPMIQENLPIRALMRGFMNQWAGRSPQTFIDVPVGMDQTSLGGVPVPYPKLTRNDLADALGGFLQTMTPPPPPTLGTIMAAKGQVWTGGYTGDLYTRKSNKYDPGYKESNLELAVRQIAPAIADIFMQSVHAFMDAPDVKSGAIAAAKQGGQRILSKTPFARDFSTHVIGHSANPPVSGSPGVNQRLFELSRQFQDLDKRYNTWEGKKGEISLKGPGVSPYGLQYVEGYLPEPPPINPKTGNVMHAGLTPEEPPNQLYKEFMVQMEEHFKKDSPDKGGIGYRSLWKNYSMWAQEAARLNAVNYGNSWAWVNEQNTKPEMIEYLKKNNVNPYDFFAVKNFMNYNRGKVGGVILNTISAVEQKFNNDPRVQEIMKKKFGGKKFTFDMLDPNEEGISEPGQQGG